MPWRAIPTSAKSTVFNELTGLNQHTGNWPGKTVCNAQGTCAQRGGAMSWWISPAPIPLMALSAEEEVARDFLCFGGADAAVVDCDATCLERNLNLVLQTMEITPRVVVCLNLWMKRKRSISASTYGNWKSSWGERGSHQRPQPVKGWIV